MKYRLQISNHTSVTVFGFTLLNPGTGELSVSFFIRCLEITEIIEHFVRYFSQYLISKVGSGVAEWSVGDGELVLQWSLGLCGHNLGCLDEGSILFNNI